VQYPRTAKLPSDSCQHPPPHTSVGSERLFSAAGDMYSDQRMQLAPERAEMLLFIREKCNYISNRGEGHPPGRLYPQTFPPSFSLRVPRTLAPACYITSGMGIGACQKYR